MREEKELKGAKGSTLGKVRKLQKQYNKILVDLFDQFAAESIEAALEKNEGSFGENIHNIVQDALDELKGKILNELGVEMQGCEMAVGISPAVDGMGIMTGESPIEMESEDESEESEEEEDESEEDESEEDEDESEEDEEEDEELNEDLSYSAIIAKSPAIKNEMRKYNEIAHQKKLQGGEMTPDLEKQLRAIKTNIKLAAQQMGIDIYNVPELAEIVMEKAPPSAKSERMVKYIKKSAKKAGKGEKEAKRIAYATAWKKYNESVFISDKVLTESRKKDQLTLTEAYASMYSEASVFGQEKGSPRFGGATLNFESDTDRALFIVSGKNKSAAHDKYLNYLEQQGITDIEEKGTALRNYLKQLMEGDFNTPRDIDVPVFTK